MAVHFIECSTLMSDMRSRSHYWHTSFLLVFWSDAIGNYPVKIRTFLLISACQTNLDKTDRFISGLLSFVWLFRLHKSESIIYEGGFFVDPDCYSPPNWRDDSLDLALYWQLESEMINSFCRRIDVLVVHRCAKLPVRFCSTVDNTALRCDAQQTQSLFDFV
jgi:hypothetical protein